MRRTALTAIVLAALATGCSTRHETAIKQTAASERTLPEPEPVQVIDRRMRPPLIADGAKAMPGAHVYRMTGPYAHNVPVTLGPDGSIASYPAVTDITPAAEPIELADGWWLDRRGVSDNSVFTRYTYAEYAALPQTPAASQLREAVIAGARVTDVATLPMTTQEAVADTAAVNAWIRANRQQLRLTLDD